MPSSRELISSQVLGTSAASVTFSSIPSTYKDLVLRWSTRADAGVRSMSVYFNGNNAGTLYSANWIQGNGASSSANIYSSYAYIPLNSDNSSSYTANTFSTNELYIPSYTSSQNKPLSIFGASENNATTAYMYPVAGLWRSTSSITSISIDQLSANFVSGSSFYLYGIKSS